MTRTDIARLDADDVQRLDNALAGTPASGLTRRSLVARAAVTAAAASVIGPTSAAFAAGAGSDDPQTILNTAITAEALAVTYLTGVIANVHDPAIDKFKTVLKAANQAEYDHYEALKGLGAKPITERFWAPDAAFDPKNVFPFLETAETLFVNAYLIGTTAFAKAGNADAARYASEILGVEAQHRALVRFAQGELPDDVAFEDYSITSIGGIVAALKKAGVGFGAKGAKPGAFYTFKAPPRKALVGISHDKPE